MHICEGCHLSPPLIKFCQSRLKGFGRRFSECIKLIAYKSSSIGRKVNSTLRSLSFRKQQNNVCTIAGTNMQIVPWNRVSSWHCNACGLCCRHYDVVLNFAEWLSIVKHFGVEFTAPDLTKFFLRRRADGSCAFLRDMLNVSFCNLQHAKPQACKLWPFKVLDKPKYGHTNKAIYYYGNRRLFVYVDSVCTGLKFGTPTKELTYSVIPEFIEIVLGIRRKQFKTTSYLQPPASILLAGKQALASRI